VQGVPCGAQQLKLELQHTIRLRCLNESNLRHKCGGPHAPPSAPRVRNPGSSEFFNSIRRLRSLRWPGAELTSLALG
jgi:hypothetical protein